MTINLPNTPTNSFLERIANSLCASANYKLVYGDQIEKDGIKIIPVAKVSYGFGGGSGSKQGEHGKGAGVGVHVQPIGYIEINKGEVTFKRISFPISSSFFLLASGIAGYLLLKGLTQLFRNNLR